MRAYYTLRHLSARHAITLLSFVRDAESTGAMDHLSRFCSTTHVVPMRRSSCRDAWHFCRSLACAEPFLIVRDWRKTMCRTIGQVLENNGPFDVIHADQLSMAPYALYARRLAGTVPVTVLDQHNAVFRIPERMAEAGGGILRRLILRMEARKLARYEVAACNAFDRVVWVTAADREALKARGLIGWEDRRGAVIPIAIQPSEHRVATKTAHVRRVTFVGGLHWPPNEDGVAWFTRAVWPAVKSAVPDAIFTVVGRRSSRPSSWHMGEAVEFAGYVADLAPYLEQTAVFIVPLMAGGGMRVKILDAWAHALPVVSTTVGAEGMETVPGKNILLADTQEAFAHAVIRVLKEHNLGLKLGLGGRRTLETYYDWRRSYAAWDEVYECASYSSFHTCPV